MWRFKFKRRRKIAFTLAETLIAMAIIGIIAAVLLPLMMDRINTMSWAKEKDNFEAKMEEAAKRMNIEGLLSGYSTNDEFVNTLQQYIKVAGRCSVSNLSDCFVSSFTNSDGTVISISSLSTGADFGDDANTSSLVGLRLADGVNAILAFKSDCTPPEWYDTSSGSSYSASSSSRSYTPGATTNCLLMLYDVNGNQKPNEVDKDIRAWHVTFSTCDGVEVGSLCVDITNTSYTYLGTFESGGFTYNNHWAGAIAACEAKGMELPSKTQLNDIYNAAYNSGSGTYDASLASQLNMTGYYWTSTEHATNTANAYYQLFTSGGTGNYYKGNHSNVRCVK
ncbi:MAG: prepilin-type N-terminal cleavage/methylation domain-containing protein [Candidatus Gastranaerophilales bacterium]|nr:prepilin-type N-terminal cleavage/methylation domain-containing protein [Candidatus Gastranaerophilales bacterium]